MPFADYLGDDDSARYLERMLDDPSSGIDAPAAIILETIQGEGGLNTASRHWLQRVAAIAKRIGALLIVDDIQAGIGRSGQFFSFEFAGIRPDIVTLAKSLSGYGLPLSAVLIHRDHDQWDIGQHNGTFRGNAHAFATATAALETFWQDDELVKTVELLGTRLQSSLEALADEFPGTRRKGRAMLQGLAMPSGATASRVVENAFERGLILETSGPRGEVLKVLAPLVISPAELDEGLAILRDAIAAGVTEELPS